MLLAAIIILFIVGYIVIALEHPLHIDKAATALFIGAGCWALYVLGLDTLLTPDRIPEAFRAEMAGHSEGHELALHYAIEGQFLPLIGEIAYILFFLMGAMTIVELVDAYEGFSIITDRIKTLNKVKLLWTVCVLTFFLSAVLDNLTTTIVMVSLMKKLVKDRETRLFFCGLIVVSANAGGAWTVIGDVTTTMLWIGDKISTIEVMKALILPSLACLVIPLAIATLMLKGDVERPEIDETEHDKTLKPWHSMLFLMLGFCGLIFVPIFKTVTHLPPFMGMMFSLSVILIISEFVKHDLDEATRSSTNVVGVLKKIDTASILFFLGILLAVGTLQSTGVLRSLAAWLQTTVPNMQVVALIIGLLSAIVDNVPLVAAGIGMYDYPKDDTFWLFLAYCAGTGGSCLIIGSAAGVAAMGLEKIDFLWYIKRVSLWALVGYLGGAGVFVIQEKFMPHSSAAQVDEHFESAEGTSSHAGESHAEAGHAAGH